LELGGPPAPTAEFGWKLDIRHLWHLAVHEHDVVWNSSKHFDGFVSVASHVCTNTELFKYPDGYLLIDGVVLGHQSPGTVPRELATAGPVLLVGAGRFERPTPCAQDGRSDFAKIPYFQRILFQRDAASLLKAVELCGTLGFSHLQNHLQHRIASGRAFDQQGCKENVEDATGSLWLPPTDDP
jgi:hypothetical protein